MNIILDVSNLETDAWIKLCTWISIEAEKINPGVRVEEIQTKQGLFSFNSSNKIICWVSFVTHSTIYRDKWKLSRLFFWGGWGAGSVLWKERLFFPFY